MCESKPVISFDDFIKLDLRVATVVEVAEHPNADKLIVLQIDLGDERRQIVAGLKAYYAPEALLGKQIVVVTNLEPRKMRGVESQGMLLAGSAGEDGEGVERSVVVLTPDSPLPPGATVS